ncbi:hypothetical protein BHE74_00043928 [Ensete ventricosum]|nr:hypothetical protein BHE74_00043928 [Ensete ventricosum]
MEFPFGHQRHHQQRRAEEDEGEERRFPPHGQHHHGQPPPPSSYYGGGAEEEYGRPAYPPVQHVPHGGGARYGETLPQPPAPGYHGGGAEEVYGRPAYPPVQHVSQGYGESRPHPTAGGYHGGGGGGDELHRRHPTSYSSGGHDGCEEEPSRPRQPTVRIFTRAEENYSLSIRDGTVILARNDPSDPFEDAETKAYEKGGWDNVQKRILESILYFWHLTILDLTIRFSCRDIGINFY